MEHSGTRPASGETESLHSPGFYFNPELGTAHVKVTCLSDRPYVMSTLLLAQLDHSPLRLYN